VARKRNPRTDRLVRDALADLLASEVADPRLALVSITEVDVTPDHDVATIYYLNVDPSLVSRDPRRSGGDRPRSVEEVQAGFEAATPRLRSMLGSRVRLRTTPELRFRPDPVAEQAGRVESLLREMRPPEDVPVDDEVAADPESERASGDAESP